MAGLVITVEPALEPISVADAKIHLRVDGSDDDLYIGDLIAAARAQVENFTARALLPQTWEYRLDGGFPPAISLPIGPVSSISSIIYIADDGTETTLAASGYQSGLARETAIILPAYSQTWPATRPVLDAVKVTFVAGYADEASIPRAMIQALKLILGHWYENREAVVVGTIASELPLGVKNLLRPWVRSA